MADLVYMHKDKWTDHLDAIRAKAGTQDAMTVDEATTAVAGISGGTDTSDATMTSGDQMLDGVTAYSRGVKYTGTIPSKTSSDLTASGATVTVPAGHYASESTKSVESGSATTPATSITANPSISVSSSGLITASVSGSQSVTPTVSAGYVSSGTAGTVSVSGSNTSQLSTQAAATITPSTSQQTAVAANKYTTGAVVVDAMPTGTAGTPTASKGAVSNHSVSVTPSVTNSTGYITGGTKTGTAVTVAASELVSGNKAITSNGTNIDVTEYSTVSVNVSGGDMTVTDTTDTAGGTIRSIAGTITSGTATVTNPISKVILNNTTQMDVTTVTATAADVASGKTFLKADGTVGTGTASGGGGAVLPAAYTQMKYLESSGTQYIDTGLYTKAAHKYDVIFSCGTATINIFGNNLSGCAVFMQSAGGLGTYYRFGSTSYANRSDRVAYETTANDRLTIDGIYAYDYAREDYILINSISDSSVTEDSTIHNILFGRTTGTNSRQLSASKIYYFACHDGDTKIMELYPAMRNSDSVLGMYDIINDDFYTNAGTGTFTGGTLS